MRFDAQASALADLALFLGLAERADPGGVARLSASGDVLAAMVCPLRGAGTPTAIGVRALRLRRPLVLDATVGLTGLRAMVAAQAAAASGEDEPMPAGAASSGGAAWAGVVPPRDGWTPVADPGDLDPALLEAAVVGAGRLRLLDPREVAGDPVMDQTGRRYGRCGPWIRLATAHGDVVARHPSSLLIRQRR